MRRVFYPFAAVLLSAFLPVEAHAEEALPAMKPVAAQPRFFPILPHQRMIAPRAAGTSSPLLPPAHPQRVAKLAPESEGPQLSAPAKSKSAKPLTQDQSQQLLSLFPATK